jgi:hypothetical protein
MERFPSDRLHPFAEDFLDTLASLLLNAAYTKVNECLHGIVRALLNDDFGESGQRYGVDRG